MKKNARTEDLKLKGRLDYEVGKHKQGGNYVGTQSDVQGGGNLRLDHGSSCKTVAAQAPVQIGAAAGQFQGSSSSAVFVDGSKGDNIMRDNLTTLPIKCGIREEDMIKEKEQCHRQVPNDGLDQHEIEEVDDQ